MLRVNEIPVSQEGLDDHHLSMLLLLIELQAAQHFFSHGSRHHRTSIFDHDVQAATTFVLKLTLAFAPLQRESQFGESTHR